jgi:dTDP-4-dehydrorhamnose reductase
VEIVEAARRYKVLKVSQITPISTSDYPTPARRPMNSVLDCSKIEKHFGIYPSAWAEGLAIVIKELIGEEEARTKVIHS